MSKRVFLEGAEVRVGDHKETRVDEMGGLVRSTYRVHACDYGEVGTGVILGREEETHALRRGDVDHFRFRRLGIHAINLDDLHRVALDPEVLAGKGAHVDDAEKVRLARLNGDGHVLGVIDEGGLGDRLGSGGVGLAQEAGDEVFDLIVVPVRQGEDDLVVSLVLVGEVRVMDDERTTKTVGVLAVVVRMIPVRPGLVDLEMAVSMSFFLLF